MALQGRGVKRLEAVERDLIERALRASDGNVSRAARLLRLERTKLLRRMRRYGIGR